MSYSFVVRGAGDLAAEYTLLGYETLLPDSIITGSGQIDQKFAVSNALDFRDNTKFSPGDLIDQEYIFEQGVLGQCDYFGILAINSETAGMTVKVEVFDTDVGAYVEVANFGGVQNGKPRVVYFGDQSERGYFDTVRQRITISSIEKLYIISMFLGKAKVFPRTPSLGFQPAHTSPMDKVENTRTKGNNLTAGRRISMGYRTKGSINYVEFEDLDEWLPNYQQHVLNSRPMYMVWSSNRPNQAIYGAQNPLTMCRPSYITNKHSHFNFEINGFA